MRINTAIEFAAKAHKDQLRKGTQLPYLVHLFEVGLILAQNGADEDTIIAGILHDTLEDTATTAKEIAEVFGQDIATLIEAESENKALTWHERKQATLDHLSVSTNEKAKMIACADKLSNLRGIVAAYSQIKDKVWDRFKKGYEDQKWYYTGIADALSSLDKKPMYEEYKKLCSEFFK